MIKTIVRILIVDDEPWSVQFVREHLELMGYEALVATDGQMAIESAADERPDLILLDIGMPDLDRYEVCQRIREFSAVPIIMLGTLSRDSDKVKGLQMGADDYIVKPFNIGELGARIRAMLRRTRYPRNNGRELSNLGAKTA
jgi:two-component system KDP operon response regulator KdpE